MNILIFIVILLVLVLVHEWGHFFTAKKFGIRVDEFGFGFPPKIYGKKIGETEYSLNLLPIGGFVKIFGENPDDENTNGPDKDRSFVHKPRWQQAIVLFAGIFMNFVLAWVLFSISFMSGLPTSVRSDMREFIQGDTHLVVISVLENSSAEKAGLKSGDKIVHVESEGVVLEDINPETFREFVGNKGGKNVAISYLEKDNIEKNIIVVPEIKEGIDKALIGISMDELGVVKFPFGKAIVEGFKMNFIMIKATMVGLYHFIVDGISGRGSLASVSGPVGLVGVVGDAYKFGFVYLLSFAALISINLGVINLVPFPALDGGRLLFLLIEKIKGSRISPKFANIANAIGFFVLIGLMVLVTYHDIAKMF
ncbi:MAG: RIP metalloprotease RseP [bacterium]|nr:RIP metalloprotease RseP [bacterium]